jgi:hypothetical protein
MPKHYWTVTIPYYHKFTVVAETEEEAISLAHDQEGVIVGYDDNDAEVELADGVFGEPVEEE